MTPFESRSIRLAFSLLEVLVVVAVIGILMALLVPAIMMARQVAQKSNCTSNLKQLSLAIQNYESTHGLYPPGYIDGQTHPYYAWSTLILPHLEHGDLHGRIDFEGGRIEAEANETAYRTVLAVFLCPSDPASPLQPLLQLGNRDAALSNYPASAGLASSGTTGLFFRNSRLTASAVRDGDSHTLLLGERRRPRVGMPTVWYAAFGGDESLVLAETSDSINGNAKGYSSHHSGGANLAFCDGSVRFLTDSVDISVLRAIATRSGEEPVPEMP